MGMLALALSVTLAAAWGADEVPMITGEQWTQSSPELKKAYLIGIANAFQVEATYHATKPPSSSQRA